jgi:HSP20 family molecular chaperone IbpA
MNTKVSTTQEARETETVAGDEMIDYRQPEVDIFEKEDSILLVANIPGAERESTDITLEKNLLTITAKTDGQLPEGFDSYYAENRIGGYRRQFRLTDGVERDGITASVKNGVLRVTLKKAKELLPVKIDIV